MVKAQRQAEYHWDKGDVSWSLPKKQTSNNKENKLWDTMKNDVMKGKTQKKKNKLIQDILNN